jgi:type II secretion system protein N
MRYFKESAARSLQPKKNTQRALVCALFLFSLICGFYLAFPDTALKQALIGQLEKQLPVRIELAEAYLRPLLTVTGKQARVTLPSEEASILQIDSFSLSPKWLSTITGDPGIKGVLHSSPGQIYFHWQKSGELGIQGTDINFEIPLATSPAMRIAGELKTAVIETEAPIKKQTESLLEISLGRVTIRGLEAISGNPNGLQLGNLTMQATGQGNAFTIKNIQTSEGDLLIAGQGTLILAAADPIRSRINLNLTVSAGKSADPTLASLLELAGTKQPNGSRKLRLTGTLTKPIIR